MFPLHHHSPLNVRPPSQHMQCIMAVLLSIVLVAVSLPLDVSTANAQSTTTVTIDSNTTYQVIDGFGTCLAGGEAQQAWWQQLYYDDLGASILRVDLTPRFKSPYSDNSYNSPWFHNNPALPGPDGNNVRTYTGPNDYSREYNGRRAQIAVMKADANQNIGVFDYAEEMPKSGGLAAQAGQSRDAALGDFKLVGSIWSPAPWLKVASGNKIGGQSGIMPANGTPWPFVWFDNFAGGKLDVSGQPLAVFNDGTENTSALTQFARSTAAYILGYQRTYNVKFYAISIQNELNFEQFYNSATYPLSSQYIAALKAARAEFDKYPELRDIKIMGPEDLMGGDAYGMWEYGGPTHKNLQYLQNIEADPQAAAAVDFYNIHGYAGDGVSSAGAKPQMWDWWANGWDASPAGGIPANIKGFADYGKKSWMTETSGEDAPWLSPSSGFPGNGAWSIALKIQQALTTGQQSAWIYWQFTDGSPTSGSTLTDATARTTAPKYVALKHFAKYIRPGAVRVAANVNGSNAVTASAYVHSANKSVTAVLVNSSTTAQQVTVRLPASPGGISTMQSYTSSNGSLWQSADLQASNGTITINVPAYGVTTLYGTGTGGTPTTSTPTTAPTRTATAVPATATPVPTTAPARTATAVPATSTTAPTVAPTTGVVRMDVGAATGYTDVAGNLWASDSGFAGGETFDRGPIAIDGTANDRLYQTERFGMTGYRLPMPNGRYTVRLHFAETYDGITAAGQRVFTVDVEGTSGDVDVFRESGGLNRALIRTADVTVNDGTLDIGFVAKVQNPLLNAIEVLPATSAITAPTATASPSGPRVARATLMNADTDQVIGELQDGATLDYATLPTRNLSVVVTTNPATIGSVRFGLDGNAAFQTENIAPYAIRGDNSGNLNAWTPTVGQHTLTITPYSGGSASGTAGTPVTIRFTVVDGAAPAATTVSTTRPATAVPTTQPAAAGAVNRVRIFPRSGFAGRMVGGRITGSNTSSTNGFAVLATISSAPAEGQWTELTFPNGTAYRYIKYESPAGGFGNLAEIEFYSDDTRLTGAGFGTAGSWNNGGNTFEKALDGSTSTFFDAATGDNQYVGIDRGSSSQTAAPSFNPAPGSYSSAQTVTISSVTAGATIRYTTDGTAPTCATGTAGTSLRVSTGTTVRAIACASGQADSSVSTAVYTIGAVPTPQPGGISRVYHIGNSVTDTINYNALKAMAQSSGKTYDFGRHMIPGAPLDWIWTHPDSGISEPPYGLYPNALPNYRWDAITLQPFDRMVDGDVEHARKYIDLARQRAENANTQFYIYSRWPRKNSDGSLNYDQAWLRAYTGGYDGTNETRDYFEKLVTTLRQQTGSLSKPVQMVPVGDVLYELNQRMKRGEVPGFTNVTQLYADGIHLNNVGSFVVGTTFYATMYKTDPRGMSYASYDVVGGATDRDINDALAAAIQDAVWNVVSTHPYSGVR